MIWATWRLHRALFLSVLAVTAAFALWLGISGLIAAHAWTLFTNSHCSLNYPGSSATCMSSLQGTSQFNSVNALLCEAFPAVLGLVLGAPLVAGEMEQRTNRLAWTQSITRSRWLITKLGVGVVATAGITGALAPLLWWWSDAAHRGNHIQPTNFDISGFVVVAYAVFAFMLGAAGGALIRRTGWSFACALAGFVLVRLGVRSSIRPTLISPTTATVSAFSPVGNADWYLNAGFVSQGRSTPDVGQTWATNNAVIENCLRSGFGAGKAAGGVSRCEKVHRLHYVMQFQPPSHFWALQAGESAIFIGMSAVLLALTLLVVRTWRT